VRKKQSLEPFGIVDNAFSTKDGARVDGFDEDDHRDAGLRNVEGSDLVVAIRFPHCDRDRIFCVVNLMRIG
jgi:hypothetical protein